MSGERPWRNILHLFGLPTAKTTLTSFAGWLKAARSRSTTSNNSCSCNDGGDDAMPAYKTRQTATAAAATALEQRLI